MRVLCQLLGRYSSQHKPLILFRLPETDTLFYRLSDIERLFELPPLSFNEINYDDCYRDLEDTYLNTNVLEDLADHFKRHVLTELCKFQPNDYALGLADSVLNSFPQFMRAPKEEHLWESVQLPLEDLQDVLDREAIKSEPSSPLSLYQAESTRNNAMALDTVLIHDNKRQRLSYGGERPLYTCPPISEEPTSRKNARNLTIFAPSYTEKLAGIKSAPILNHGPIPRFAKPPIVPSQQQQPKKQQYLQPFEQLFDSIETTRALKTTLDDQIRKSMSLIQTLQASTSMIEGIVRNQVQREWGSLVRRIEVLERQYPHLPDTPPLKNEIGQKEVAMLNALRDRIERLEKQ